MPKAMKISPMMTGPAQDWLNLLKKRITGGV